MWRMILIGLLAGVAQGADEIYRLDNYLQIEPNQVLLVEEGKPTPLEKELPLANGFIVHTNGTINLRGIEKQLNPGQKLTLDGLFMAKDGRFLQVSDHYLFQGGKPTLVKDGQSQAVQGEVRFPNGSRISADGWLVGADGRRTRLLDGHTLSLEGTPLATQDFVINRAGQIVLQKDGALMPLERNRVMAMSDGTKVRGDGRITRQNGSERLVPEGHRLNLPGVVPR